MEFATEKLLINPYGGSGGGTGGRTLLEVTSGMSSEKTLTIKVSGVYEIICVGAGGGGCWSVYWQDYSWSAHAGGGGGGSVKGEFYLTAGNYNYKVGNGGANGGAGYVQNHTGGTGESTYFGSAVTANGGGGGSTTYTLSTSGGGGGSYSYNSNLSVSIDGNITGNGYNGGSALNQAVEGGSSRYGSYGHGGSSGGSGSSGYLRVVYKRRRR